MPPWKFQTAFNRGIIKFGTSILCSIFCDFETPLPWWCPQAFPPGRPRVRSLGRISPYWPKGDFFKVIRELRTDRKKSSVRLVQTTEDFFRSVAMLPSGGTGLNWFFDHNRPAEHRIEVPNPCNVSTKTVLFETTFFYSNVWIQSTWSLRMISSNAQWPCASHMFLGD